jgi:hypothetical protein
MLFAYKCWPLKMSRNITIATFAENGLFKHEAYGANLRGPKILEDHGVRIVLKSVSLEVS